LLDQSPQGLIQLAQVFRPTTSYEIIGRRTFIGIDQIRAHFEHNIPRQQALSIQYRIDLETAASGRAYFLANFYDKNDKEWQSVAGTINFCFSPDG